MPDAAPPLLFRARQRLSRDRDYDAVFSARARKHRGPITVFARPNQLPHHRLGLSISRRVGNAVTRNRLKRRLREAFRLLQHDLPGSYDFVITARRHQPLTTDQYAEHLRALADALHALWSRRGSP